MSEKEAPMGPVCPVGPSGVPRSAQQLREAAGTLAHRWKFDPSVPAFVQNEEANAKATVRALAAIVSELADRLDRAERELLLLKSRTGV